MNGQDALYTLKRNVEMRWLNPENPDGARHAGGQTGCGRKGRPCRGEMKAGETWLLGEGEGEGTIRRMWFTASGRSPEILRGVVLRMWWDGAARPAVEAPLADFFCNPHGRSHVFANLWFNNPENRNWNSTIPMPFRTSFRIEVTNESPVDIGMFWYHIDYTLGDEHGEDTGYFHAYWNRENPTVQRQDFRILPQVKGRGRYLGCNLGLITRPYYRSWWGEGEVKIYLDGDGEYPTLCGTGTEDYICTAWGTGTYSLPEYGCNFLKSVDGDRQQIAMYRLHQSDPVYFQQEIRVEMQQIGYWSGDTTINQLASTGQSGVMPAASDGKTYYTLAQLQRERPALSLFEREDDWCATAYFYLDRPESGLPPLAPYSERVADLSGEPEPVDALLAQVEQADKFLPSVDALAAWTGKGMAREQAHRAVLNWLTYVDRVMQARREAPALAAASPGSPKCASLGALLAGIEGSGRLSPTYLEALREREATVMAQCGIAGVVRAYWVSALLPKVDDITHAVLPDAAMLKQVAPFDPVTELGDVRPAHDSKDGLVYIEGRITFEQAFKGALAYGADGPVKVWVNGVAADVQPEATNPARIGEYEVNVEWKQGENRITFAMHTNNGKTWGVVARVMSRPAPA